MIPVKLTLQGIYSYRQRQIIDFEQLTQAGLFGLFGSVGSGKSTIIEAISFALYGETERLNARDNRNYNMMNLKSDELLIDFEFKTGADNHYRFVVKGRRNSKRFDDVKTFERSAYRFDGNDWFPLDSTSAEPITGLSYNNFHRTIIIPQGQFMEFLQLSAKDRTTMLQELFGLERFELFGRVADVERRNDADIQNLKGQLQTLGDINANQLKELDEAMAVFQLHLKELADENHQLTTAIQEYERIKALHQKMALQQQQLTTLQTNQKEMLTLEAEEQEFERLSIAFKSTIDRLLNLRQALDRGKAEYDEAIKKTILNDQLLADSLPDLEKHRLAFDNKEGLLRQADELGKVVMIRELEIKNIEAIERIKKGTELVDNATQQQQTLQASIEQSKRQREALHLSTPDRDTLMAVKDWFTHTKNYQSSIKECEKKVLQLNNEVAAKASQLKNLSGEKGLIIDSTSAASIPEQIDAHKKRHEASLLQSRQQMLELEIQHKLQSFASSLHDGKPCPLCGSEHHPHILNAADVSHHIAKLHLQITEAESALKRITTVEKEMAQLDTQVQSLNHQFLSEMKQLEERSKQLFEHQQAFVWKTYSPDNEQQLLDAIALAQKNTAELDKTNQQIEHQQKAIEKGIIDREKYAKALDEIEKQRTTNASQIALLMSQLELINPAELAQQSIEAVTQLAGEKRKQHAVVVSDYETSTKRVQELNNQKALLTGTIDTINKNTTALTADYNEAETLLTRELASAGGLSLDYVTSIVQKKLDVDAIKKRIESWRKEVDTANSLIKQYVDELAGKTYDEKAYIDASTRLMLVTQQMSNLNQFIGKTQTDLLRLKADLEKQSLLQKQLELLELRASDLAVMKNLFKGSGFVNYISTVYLQNLCLSANDRFFKLTRQQLSLELADDNSFQVRDYMNEGKVRSVKTLSGGQTFQASLSLALALADSIQHLSSSHENFFFLDEGFGTLDKESLSTVFETLKALRKENRIVGVISHVEEMQQEIGTYLKIVNLEEIGSMITESWK